MTGCMNFALLFLLLASQTALGDISIPLQAGVDPPKLLSETGLFRNPVAGLEPVAELRPYQINQPLWVDYAQKQRWIHLPAGQKIGFSATGPWKFPVGTVLVKHFWLEVSQGRFRDLETRVLVRKEGEATENWAGYSYQWEGSDARLVPDLVSPKLEIAVDASAPGGARNQLYTIPSRRQCLQCHHASVGSVRSVRTHQLNRVVDGANQLDAWNGLRLFGDDIGPAAAYDAFPELRDEKVPPEKRARSYLDVNCAHCHNPDPAAFCSFTGMDLRFEQLSAKALADLGYLVAGAKDQSELFLRMESEQPGYRMPFIGTALRDPLALDVVGRWIDGLGR
jgi:uncharacterized repeat protein (TIGR03806 family)